MIQDTLYIEQQEPEGIFCKIYFMDIILENYVVSCLYISQEN